MLKERIGLIERARRYSEQRVMEYGAQYFAFCGFILLFFFLLPYRWRNPGYYPEYVLYGLRAFSYILCALIALKRFWPRPFKPYLPLFWHFTLLYCFPFRTTFNVLYSQHSTSFSRFGVLGIVALAVLVDRKTFSILLALGIVSGVVFYVVTGGATATVPDSDVLVLAFTLFGVVAFTKHVFFRQNEIAHLEKLKAFKLLAGSIAHEMRTPLATFAHASAGLQNHMPVLIGTHKQAQAAGLEVEPIAPQHLDAMDDISRQFRSVSQRALRTIDQLLAHIRHSSNTDARKFSMTEAVERGLKDHPWRPGQRERVSFDANKGFEIWGNPALFGQVISNLLDNSLSAIESAGKGDIKIWFDSTWRTKRIHFRDTAQGISKESLPHIFEHFYTSKKHGTGVGLAFCKMIIQELGGKISCDSVEGEFTEFTITFPKE